MVTEKAAKCGGSFREKRMGKPLVHQRDDLGRQAHQAMRTVAPNTC